MKAPRRVVSHLVEDMVGALLFEPTRVDDRLVQALRAEVRDAAVRPAVVADVWERRRAELRECVLRGDPASFLRWPPVRTTMVKRGKAPVAHELRHLRRRADWRRRWRPALREVTIGRPRPFHRCPSTSGQLIHQAYHLCSFEEATGRSIVDTSFVVEFGGGYGSLCRLLHRLGFHGTYVIVDLPEVSALQRFFLRSVGIPVGPPPRPGAAIGAGVLTVSDPGLLKTLVDQKPAGLAAFIAAWSLGETPLEARAPILSSVAGLDHILIGYTERFEGIDNVRFFAQWRLAQAGHVWHDVSLPHLNKPEWYLFGVRNGRP